MAIVSTALCFFCGPASVADEGPETTSLWSKTADHGGWRPFGNGLEDSETSGSGVKLIVSWGESKWGVGVVYPDPQAESKPPVPNLSKYRKLRIEMKGEEADQTEVTAELAIGEEKEFRADPKLNKAASNQWQTLEFRLPEDFPNLTADDLGRVDTVRILFLKPAGQGRNNLEFRNATLLP